MPNASNLGDPRSGRLRCAALAVAVVALGMAAYANALHAGFVYDDVPSIVRNGSLRDLSSYLPGHPGYQGRPNRVIAYLSFALDYRVAGLEPTWFHAVNVVVHLVNALLVLALGLLLFRTPRLRGSRLAPLAPAIAFAAAALFVAHPIQTQAVTYVVQRLTSLAALFYLAAVVLYLRARTGGRGRGAIAYLGALLAALLATKTKEIAFTLPAALLACEGLFLEGPIRRRALLLAPFALVAALIPTSLVQLGKPLAELLADTASATVVQTAVGRLDYLRTEVGVVASYVRLLALPVGQNADPDVAISRSFLEPRVLVSGAVLAGLAMLAVSLGWPRLHRGKDRDPAGRLVAFGSAWFFLALSVESSIIPIVDVMNEQRVYLPSVGFFLAAASGIGLLAQRSFPGRAGAAVITSAAILAGALAVATHLRNQVWQSELTLWSDTAARSPGKPRPLNNLGAALSDAGRGEEAAQAFLAAIRASPEHAEAYYNLGRLSLKAGGPIDETIRLFQTAISLRPDYRDAYANLGGAYVQAGRPADAIQVLERAGPTVLDSVEAQFNLGVARALLGDLDRAGEQVEVLRRLDSPLAAQLDAFLRSGTASAPRGGP